MCSGADTQLLSKTSKAEQIKYAGIGGTVFFTAIMATIAASYALNTVFNSIPIAIIFGIVWGLLIFNLDRFIVSTIKKSAKKWREIVQVTPRIILAIIIAVVISKPLELKLFEKEINREILAKKNNFTLANKNQIAQQFTPEINKIQSEINDLKEEVTSKETETNNLYNTYIAEAEGTAGTKLLGKGPVYKEKREKHDASLAELQQLKQANQSKITSKENEIANLIALQKENELNSQPIIDNFDGLMARINALNKLPWVPSFFIFLLFLAIETAPIFAKLIAPKGEYDYLLEETEAATKNWVKQQVNQQQLQLQTANTVNQNIYNDLTNEEELYAYKKQKAKALLQSQADAFYKKQQRILG